MLDCIHCHSSNGRSCTVAGKRLAAERRGKTACVSRVEITEDTIDPIVWGKNFPRQYDGYRRTVDKERTKHGGSETLEKLDEDPRWREIFKGYAFGVDYRENRVASIQDCTKTLKT